MFLRKMCKLLEKMAEFSFLTKTGLLVALDLLFRTKVEMSHEYDVAFYISLTGRIEKEKSLCGHFGIIIDSTIMSGAGCFNEPFKKSKSASQKSQYYCTTILDRARRPKLPTDLPSTKPELKYHPLNLSNKPCRAINSYIHSYLRNHHERQ